jgi:glycerol kinase
LNLESIAMRNPTSSRLFVAALAGLHAPVWAHDGHGLWGSHWHATDAWGFVVAIAVALAVWAIGRRK